MGYATKRKGHGPSKMQQVQWYKNCIRAEADRQSQLLPENNDLANNIAILGMSNVIPKRVGPEMFGDALYCSTRPYWYLFNDKLYKQARTAGLPMLDKYWQEVPIWLVLEEDGLSKAHHLVFIASFLLGKHSDDIDWKNLTDAQKEEVRSFLNQKVHVLRYENQHKKIVPLILCPKDAVGEVKKLVRLSLFRNRGYHVDTTDFPKRIEIWIADGREHITRESINLLAAMPLKSVSDIDSTTKKFGKLGLADSEVLVIILPELFHYQRTPWRKEGNRIILFVSEKNAGNVIRSVKRQYNRPLEIHVCMLEIAFGKDNEDFVGRLRTTEGDPSFLEHWSRNIGTSKEIMESSRVPHVSRIADSNAILLDEDGIETIHSEEEPTPSPKKMGKLPSNKRSVGNLTTYYDIKRKFSTEIVHFHVITRDVWTMTAGCRFSSAIMNEIRPRIDLRDTMGNNSVFEPDCNEPEIHSQVGDMNIRLKGLLLLTIAETIATFRRSVAPPVTPLIVSADENGIETIQIPAEPTHRNSVQIKRERAWEETNSTNTASSSFTDDRVADSETEEDARIALPLLPKRRKWGIQ
eukprot:ANDGO_01346.mRNA.1 hypothetical protein